ncbi:DoxX family protein [Nocardiopsis sp. N85]|uniref:DoxX family protein n=1 Tax=Nocardiopsis sp. N85 TaxID=3029400 RepID=UPI00237F252F|nr:DoxX family protein [Nocardiopsis sp. N85]MDE3721936.1 DoxX family protein [Nocardiopsis sp. N85]
MNVVFVILTVLLAVFFLALGTAKILARPQMRLLAEKSGFSVGAYRGIGVLEAAGGIGLLLGLAVPPLGGLAGTGLLLLLAGALITHLRRGDGPRELAPAAIAGLLVAVHLALGLVPGLVS